MKRKTIEIRVLVEEANKFLLNSADCMEESRQSLGIFITDLLMRHGQYRGFNFLTVEAMLKSLNGDKPGIRGWVNGEPNFNDTDNTRIFFYPPV